jgi:hypothetical protein
MWLLRLILDFSKVVNFFGDITLRDQPIKTSIKFNQLWRKMLNKKIDNNLPAKLAI